MQRCYSFLSLVSLTFMLLGLSIIHSFAEICDTPNDLSESSNNCIAFLNAFVKAECGTMGLPSQYQVFVERVTNPRLFVTDECATLALKDRLAFNSWVIADEPCALDLRFDLITPTNHSTWFEYASYDDTSPDQPLSSIPPIDIVQKLVKAIEEDETQQSFRRIVPDPTRFPDSLLLSSVAPQKTHPVFRTPSLAAQALAPLFARSHALKLWRTIVARNRVARFTELRSLLAQRASVGSPLRHGALPLSISAEHLEEVRDLLRRALMLSSVLLERPIFGFTHWELRVLLPQLSHEWYSSVLAQAQHTLASPHSLMTVRQHLRSPVAWTTFTAEMVTGYYGVSYASLTHDHVFKSHVNAVIATNILAGGEFGVPALNNIHQHALGDKYIAAALQRAVAAKIQQLQPGQTPTADLRVEQVRNPQYNPALAGSSDPRGAPLLLTYGLSDVFTLSESLAPLDAKKHLRIGIPTAFWFTRHSIYRTFVRYVRALRRAGHTLDLLLFQAELSDADTPPDLSIFRSVAFLGSEATQQIAAVRARCAAERYDVLLYLDVGMSWASVFLSNLRLAPVQLTVQGHSVSTFGSQIDYFITGDEAEMSNLDAVATQYNETVVIIPGLGVANEIPDYLADIPRWRQINAYTESDTGNRTVCVSLSGKERTEAEQKFRNSFFPTPAEFSVYDLPPTETGASSSSSRLHSSFPPLPLPTPTDTSQSALLTSPFTSVSPTFTSTCPQRLIRLLLPHSPFKVNSEYLCVIGAALGRLADHRAEVELLAYVPAARDRRMMGHLALQQLRTCYVASAIQNEAWNAELLRRDGRWGARAGAGSDGDEEDESKDARSGNGEAEEDKEGEENEKEEKAQERELLELAAEAERETNAYAAAGMELQAMAPLPVPVSLQKASTRSPDQRSSTGVGAATRRQLRLRRLWARHFNRAVRLRVGGALRYPAYLARLQTLTHTVAEMRGCATALMVEAFPFGGVNTVVDAVWAGVPFFAFEGPRFNSRAGAAMLRRLAPALYRSMVARTAAQLEDRIVRFARDGIFRAHVTALQRAADVSVLFGRKYGSTRFLHGPRAGLPECIGKAHGILPVTHGTSERGSGKLDFPAYCPVSSSSLSSTTSLSSPLHAHTDSLSQFQPPSPPLPVLQALSVAEVLSLAPREDVVGWRRYRHLHVIESQTHTPQASTSTSANKHVGCAAAPSAAVLGVVRSGDSMREEVSAEASGRARVVSDEHEQMEVDIGALGALHSHSPFTSTANSGSAATLSAACTWILPVDARAVLAADDDCATAVQAHSHCQLADTGTQDEAIYSVFPKVKSAFHVGADIRDMHNNSKVNSAVPHDNKKPPCFSAEILSEEAYFADAVLTVYQRHAQYQQVALLRRRQGKSPLVIDLAREWLGSGAYSLQGQDGAVLAAYPPTHRRMVMPNLEAPPQSSRKNPQDGHIFSGFTEVLGEKAPIFDFAVANADYLASKYLFSEAAVT